MNRAPAAGCLWARPERLCAATASRNHWSCSHRKNFGRAGVEAADAESEFVKNAEPAGPPIIDIHQHTNYHGRTDAQLVAHQRALGITTTILLPAGRPAALPSTDHGRSNGLAAGTGGNASCRVITWQYPREF